MLGVRRMLKHFRSAVEWSRDCWISHHRLDYVLVVLVVGAHALVAHMWGIGTLVGQVPIKNRPGLYAATAMSISLVGTIASLAVAQFLNAKGERATHLKRLHPHELSGTWKGVFYGSLLAATLILLAYGFDARFVGQSASGTGSSTGAWLYELAVLIALLRLLRLIALFGELVDIIVLDSIAPIEPEAPRLNPEHFAADSMT